ncbi:MAG TPA: energy transducer TonB [Blastocatellia bacterium]|nr:energy transducer TonB [Blastocatellia bacterium]
MDPYEKEPVYVTVRVFQARAKLVSKPEPTDQTFRLRTENLTDYEKWVTSIGKAYPGLEISLLRTEPLRIFKSNKPGVVRLGPKADKNLQLQILAANSPGDGTTPGLDLVPTVEWHWGDEKKDKDFKPISYAFPPPINAEAGMTYFFTNKNLYFYPETYASFVRPGALPKNFEGDAIFFVFVLTTEPGDQKQPGGETPTARVFDEKQSAELQANATKKADPEWPAEVQRPGYSGRIQVRVEINAEGRVAHANVWNSTLPEANHQAVAAARQWEFPATAFADSKLPIHALLTFNFTAPPLKPEPAPAKKTPAPAKATPKRPARPRK